MKPHPLARPDRRQLLLGGALLAAAGTAAALQPRRAVTPPPAGALEAMVPARIGTYGQIANTGLILPDPDELRSTIYDQVLTRIYAAPSLPPILLLIAYGSAQDTGIALHRPEACYPSAGYRIHGNRFVPLSGVGGETASLLTAARADQVEQIYTWMRVADRFPASASQEKLAVIATNLTGRLADGVLVRLSVRSRDAVAAAAQMAAFNAALLHAIGTRGRNLLLQGKTDS